MIFMVKFCGINEKILCRKICLYLNFLILVINLEFKNLKVDILLLLF